MYPVQIQARVVAVHVTEVDVAVKTCAVEAGIVFPWLAWWIIGLPGVEVQIPRNEVP